MLLKQRDDIKSFLAKAPTIEIGQIWQTVNQRVIYKIETMDVFEDGVVFRADAPLLFNEDHPVYINVNYKSLIFKLKKGDYRSEKNRFVCRYPSEAKAIDERKYPRTKIPKKANITISLRSMSWETALDAKIIVHDISERGIGGNISSINYDFFQRFSTFQVVKICNETVIEEALLTRRHMYPDKKTGRYFMGFDLNRPFSNHFHGLLLEKMKENLGFR